VFCMMKNENLKLAGKKCFLRYPKIENCTELTAIAESSRKFRRNVKKKDWEKQILFDEKFKIADDY
jgi:flagellar basal body rod protein FlgC